MSTILKTGKTIINVAQVVLGWGVALVTVFYLGLAGLVYCPSITVAVGVWVVVVVGSALLAIFWAKFVKLEINSKLICFIAALLNTFLLFIIIALIMNFIYDRYYVFEFIYREKHQIINDISILLNVVLIVFTVILNYYYLRSKEYEKLCDITNDDSKEVKYFVVKKIAISLSMLMLMGTFVWFEILAPVSSKLADPIIVEDLLDNNRLYVKYNQNCFAGAVSSKMSKRSEQMSSFSTSIFKTIR